jgi:hypothetical protein
MARLFDDAQNEYLEIDSAVVGSVPLTMACKFYSDSLTASQMLMNLVDKDVDNDSLAYLAARGNEAGDPLTAYSIGPTAAAKTGVAYAINTWQHACGVWAADNDRRVYLNGGNKATNGTSSPGHTPNRTSLGRNGDSTPSSYLSGRLAWAAIWNVALTDAEVAALAAGARPPSIRPGNLVSFWSLGGFDTEETDGGTARDIWGGFDLAAGSDAVGPGIEDHPGGLIYPSQPMAVLAAGGAPFTADQFAPMQPQNILLKPPPLEAIPY